MSGGDSEPTNLVKINSNEEATSHGEPDSPIGDEEVGSDSETVNGSDEGEKKEGGKKRKRRVSHRVWPKEELKVKLGSLKDVFCRESISHQTRET